MLKYIFSFFLLFGVSALIAQPQDTSTVQVKKDYVPSMIMLGYNAVPLVNTIFYDGYVGQNGQVGLDFANNLLMVDFGYQRTIRTGATYTYNNEGTFYRIGLETNVLKNRSDANGLTLGLRYARSRFSDEMQITDDFGFGVVDLSPKNNAVKSGWLELNLGLNVKVFEQIYFGYLVRYKVYKSIKGLEGLDPFDLPGFGRNENNSTVGFDYYIRWIIPFRREPVVEE
ncbi:MAG: DUF6048 family protein [Bacteroidota bacterium]